MIRLNYKLVRDEKDEDRTYVPKAYPTEFSNLVYIKGPNGSGKSFLLHIISLALYGNHLTDDQLDPGLRRKINNLLNLDKNRLTFTLEIESDVEDLTIISRKPSLDTKDIYVYVKRNGVEQLYPKDRFLREFRLLYTIPNNPTTQLPQLLTEIRVSQNDISSRLIRFRNYLDERVRELEKSRDEINLQKMKSELAETRYALNQVEDSLFTNVEKLRKYSIYLAITDYLKAGENILSLGQSHNVLDAEIKELEKNVVKRSKEERVAEKKYTQTMSTIETKKRNLMPTLACYNFSDLKKRYTFINEASVLLEIKKPKVQNTIRENLGVFKEKIECLAKSEQTANAKYLDSLEFYKDLRRVLNNPRYYDLRIPGTEGDAGSFISIIDAEIEKVNVIQQQIDKYYTDVSKIKSFLEELEVAISHSGKPSIEFGNQGSSLEELKLEELHAKRLQISQQLKNVTEKRNRAKQRLIDAHEDPAMTIQREVVVRADPVVKAFLALSESEQERAINELKQSIDSSSYKQKQLKLLLESQLRAISDLERQPVNPNRVFLPKLKGISWRLVPLESLFRSELPSSLNKIIEKRASSFSEFDTRYAKTIGRFYARKMGTVFYSDGVYEVQSVDIVNEIIRTTTGKEINFDYLGTGHSQSSYLTTRLGMVDSKKVIALFDEVAMMDETSLSPVISLLKSKHNDGSLLGSIIVQRAEVPSVEEL